MVSAADADAPAALASPEPMATEFAPDAREPLTPDAFDAPMATAPWAVALAAAAEFPPPMATAWRAVVEVNAPRLTHQLWLEAAPLPIAMFDPPTEVAAP